MPVFAFVLTKFNKLSGKIFEICLEDEVKPIRLKNEVNLKSQKQPIVANCAVSLSLCQCSRLKGQFLLAYFNKHFMLFACTVSYVVWRVGLPNVPTLVVHSNLTLSRVLCVSGKALYAVPFDVHCQQYW